MVHGKILACCLGFALSATSAAQAAEPTRPATRPARPAAAATASTQPERALQAMRTTLLQDDVVFMYGGADDAVLKQYGATVIAWGGAEKGQTVKRLKALGIHPTGSMWCLTSGPQELHDNPDLMEGTARDIEGKPMPVPWLFDQTYQGTPSYWGCTNHPAFRAQVRRKVSEAMMGGAMGLHVDDHLGTAETLWAGGCYCDYCMRGFGDYLKSHSTPELLRQANVSSFQDFDYRTLVRKYAATRKQFESVRMQIPLREQFEDFQLQAAAENLRELGELAAEIVQHPVTLSANAGLPDLNHVVALQHLSYVVGEVSQDAPAGTERLLNAVQAYRMAETLGKPIASTAAGQDWAFVKEQDAKELVKVWIALSYACGQRMMVPFHQWCFTEKLGTHWYDPPPDSFAPLYQFVRHNPALFAGTRTLGPLVPPKQIPQSFATHAQREALRTALAAGDPKPMSAGQHAWIFPRRAADGTLIVHIINLDYDAKAKSLKPQQNLGVDVPADLYTRRPILATVHSYDAKPVDAPVQRTDSGVRVTLPQLRTWAVLQLR